MEYDLVFLKVLNRYYSDYEIPGMVYESIKTWCNVCVPCHSINYFDISDLLCTVPCQWWKCGNQH